MGDRQQCPRAVEGGGAGAGDRGAAVVCRGIQIAALCPRPDGNGWFVEPVATGLVEAESGNTLLGRCDWKRWDVGQRRRSNSPIAMTSAPTNQRLHNGFEDEDGCPDKGRIASSATRRSNRTKIHNNSTGFAASAISIIQAIAATLKGKPADHPGRSGATPAPRRSRVRELAERRAASVRQQIVLQGVAGHRLIQSRLRCRSSVGSAMTPQNCERNRAPSSSSCSAAMMGPAAECRRHPHLRRDRQARAPASARAPPRAISPARAITR